jgi:ABC-type transport system involved in multi-copper enzyme maturation permease subunit
MRHTIFGTIFRKELLENIRNQRFLLALALCVVLIPLGFAVQYMDYAAKDAAYRDAVRTFEDNHKRLGDLTQGVSMFRPPSPLSPISAGVEALLPTSIDTTGFVDENGATLGYVNSSGLGNPFRLLYGPLDLATIAAVVLSVLAVLFVFNGVSGEKERRTLAQVFANAVPRSTLITAKMAAAFVLIAAAFLVGLLIAVLTLAIQGFAVWGKSEILVPFLIAAGLALVYIFVMVNLGLLVSIRARSSLSAMVTLVMAWVALFMLMPKAAVITAKIARPVKSQQVVDLEKSQVRVQLTKESAGEIDKMRKAMPGIKDMTVDAFFKARDNKNPLIAEYEKKQDEIRNAYRERMDAEMAKLDVFYGARRDGQTRLARNLSRLSPISCFLHGVTEIAGTGLAEVDRLKENRTALASLLDNEISRKMKMLQFGNMTMGSDGNDRETPAPKLVYKTATLRDELASVWPDMALLLFYGILFFAGAYASFLRYDLR